MFFRDLPDSLCTTALYEEWITVDGALRCFSRRGITRPLLICNSVFRLSNPDSLTTALSSSRATSRAVGLKGKAKTDAIQALLLRIPAMNRFLWQFMCLFFKDLCGNSEVNKVSIRN